VSNSSNGAKNFFELAPDTPGFTALPGMSGYQQTTGYTCGPSSVMSVLRYWGALNASDMTHATEMRIAGEMGTNPVNGTTAEQVAAWFGAYMPGWEVTWAVNGSLDMLRANLAKGVPTLVDWVDWGGHWVATLGYYAGGASPGEGRDVIYFADPAAHFQDVHNARGVTGFTSDRFAAMWVSDLDMGGGGRRGVHVVAKPRHAGQPGA
jgi:hypothetical protein